MATEIYAKWKDLKNNFEYFKARIIAMISLFVALHNKLI